MGMKESVLILKAILVAARLTVLCQSEPLDSDEHYLAELDPAEREFAEALLR